MRRLPTRPGVALRIAVGATVLVLAACDLGGEDPSRRHEAGAVRLFREGGPSFARWVHRPDCGHFLRRYHRMRLYSPYADRCVKRSYRGGLAYVDAQAIYPWEVRPDPDNSPRQRRAKRRLDRLILRDARGRRLYVPFDCEGGRCPQYAADIDSPSWRARIAGRVGVALRAGYRGVFLDDVNWNVNVSDGAERPVAPIDPDTAAPISTTRWRRAVARLVLAVRAEHPGAEIAINSVWWKPESDLSNPDVARAARAATTLNFERGTLDTFRGQSYGALLRTIDRVHELGADVTLDNSAARSRGQAEFELATYFLISEGNDSVTADYGSCPSSTGSPPCEEPFWSAYRIHLGAPSGRRRARADGLLERRFARGLVLVNPPRAPRRTVRLGKPHTDLHGVRVKRVVLGGGAARVLRR